MVADPQKYQHTLNVTVPKGLTASLQRHQGLTRRDAHISKSKYSFSDVIIVVQVWRHLSSRKHAGLEADYACPMAPKCHGKLNNSDVSFSPNQNRFTIKMQILF